VEGLEYLETSSRYAQVSFPLLLFARFSVFRHSVKGTLDSPSTVYIYRFQALIREHHDDLARSIVLEQGKTFADAKGDVLRGLQMSSHSPILSCSIDDQTDIECRFSSLRS
jgi:hypothetical protein